MTQFPKANSFAPIAPVPAANAVAASQQFGISNQTDAFSIDAAGSLKVTWLGAAGGWNNGEIAAAENLFPPGAPVAASQEFDTTNQTDVFAIDNAGALRVSFVAGSGKWFSARISAENLFPLAAPVAASRQFNTTNTTDVFAVDVNGNLDLVFGNGTGPWSTYQIPAASGQFPPGAYLAASEQFDVGSQTDVFGIDDNGALRVTYLGGTGGWESAEITAQNLFPPGAPLAATQQFNTGNTTEVFVVDWNGNLDLVFYDGSGPWTTYVIPSAESQYPIRAPLAASRQFDNPEQTDVFGIDASGALRVTFLGAAGGWESAEISATNSFQPGTSVAATRQFNTTNTTDVFAVDANGNLDLVFYDGTGPWTTYDIPADSGYHTGLIAPPAAPECGHDGEYCCPGNVCTEGGTTCQVGTDKYGYATGNLCAQSSQDTGAPVMANPEVVAIYWGPSYSTPSTVGPEPTTRAQIGNSILSDIVSSTYMNNLAQYGISKGSVVESVYIASQPAAGSHITYVDAQNEIELLLHSGAISHRPSINETNLLYVVMAPPGIELWPDSTTKKADGIQGMHYHTKYNGASTRDDLIWTWVKMYNPQDPTLIAEQSGVLAHEMIESFNDPLGGRIELGDECDAQNGGADRGTYALPGTAFQVPLYWSQRDHQCVQGNW